MPGMRRGIALVAAACLGAAPFSNAQTGASMESVLHYNVEWRMFDAGKAQFRFGTGGASLKLQSAGMVSRLYRVNDQYTASFQNGFCATSTWMKAEEGSRRRETNVAFDGERRKAKYVEQDLAKGIVIADKQIDTASCVHDVIAALLKLRTLTLSPGQSLQLPVSDGKKFALARIEAQERERVSTPAGTFDAVRYEAFVFDDVIYQRKARLFIWLTEDDKRLPVQIRVSMRFYIGTITFQLEKQES